MQKKLFLFLAGIGILGVGAFILNFKTKVSAPTKVSTEAKPRYFFKKEPCPYDSSFLAQGVVDIQKIDSMILVQLKYSTTDNFMKKDVYKCLTKAFLQPEVADKLHKASQSLREKNKNLHLLIYDATRPHEIQYELWNAIEGTTEEKQKYVAPPDLVSIHNLGCAVDLTLADASGKPLDMGTPYDFFGEEAHTFHEELDVKQGKLTSKQVENRLLLRNIMKEAGFTPIKYEWWHFNAFSRAEALEKFKVIKGVF